MDDSSTIITGAEIIIRCLQEENVKFVFGYRVVRY